MQKNGRPVRLAHLQNQIQDTYGQWHSWVGDRTWGHNSRRVRLTWKCHPPMAATSPLEVFWGPERPCTQNTSPSAGTGRYLNVMFGWKPAFNHLLDALRMHCGEAEGVCSFSIFFNGGADGTPPALCQGICPPCSPGMQLLVDGQDSIKCTSDRQTCEKANSFLLVPSSCPLLCCQYLLLARWRDRESFNLPVNSPSPCFTEG